MSMHLPQYYRHQVKAFLFSMLRSFVYEELTARKMSRITQAIDLAGNTMSWTSKLLSAAGGELLYHIGLSDPEPSFPKFLDLPVELRLQIWRESLHGPRIVELVDGPGRTGRLRAQKLVTPWITPAVAPAVLHVCRESRNEALQYYQLAFGRNGFEPRIYFDFAQDMVYFGSGVHGDGMVDVDDSMQDFEKIRRLAITPNCLGRLLNCVIGTRFIGLKEIYLVNMRMHGLRATPQLKEVDPATLSETVEYYSQQLKGLQDSFDNKVAPTLKVALFIE